MVAFASLTGARNHHAGVDCARSLIAILLAATAGTAEYIVSKSLLYAVRFFFFLTKTVFCVQVRSTPCATGTATAGYATSMALDIPIASRKRESTITLTPLTVFLIAGLGLRTDPNFRADSGGIIKQMQRP